MDSDLQIMQNDEFLNDFEFSEGDVNSYSVSYSLQQYEGWHHNDLSKVSLDDISFSHEFMPVYRSLAIDSSIQSELCTSASYSYDKVLAPPKLSKEKSNTSATVLVDLFPRKVEVDSSKIYVPSRPMCLMKTHFLCYLSILDIISRVEKCLSKLTEVSFQFNKADCLFEGICCRGSSQCKFNISLFKDSDSEKSYIIEGNRLSGDGSPFRTVFNEVKAEFSAHTKLSSSDSFCMASTATLPIVEPLTDREATIGLQPIIEMAKSRMMESQVEASAILHDLSLQEEMHHSLCEENCMKVVAELLSVDSDNDSCRYNAVCTFANLSTNQTCQEFLIANMPTLCQLLKLAVDGPYYSCETRRESARIFANLCQRNSTKVLSVVGTETVRSWINSIDNIKDDRLRMHAHRAKSCIQACGVAY